jgi:N-acetylneuraminate synthase
MKRFDFKNLFILDLANNHQGNLKHALNLISAHGKVVRKHGVRAALKLQFRDLDTFIHPSHQKDSPNKQVKRFLETRLSPEDFGALLERAKEEGFLTMATPFDEPSVDLMEDLKVEIAKVASCSSDDRPLLNRILKTSLPIVASTGGLHLSQIDLLAAMLQNRSADFAIMFCMAVYPTPTHLMRLSQIDFLRARYPGISIGFSTHEDPNDTRPIQIAYGKGAELFERHIGLEAGGITLNAYSSTPAQLDAWLEGFRYAVEVCGGAARAPSPQAELDALASLKRGVFARRNLKKGEILSNEDVHFCIPWEPGSMDAGQWREGKKAEKDYAAYDALIAPDSEKDPTLTIEEILVQVRGLLNTAKISIGSQSEVEISHHHGLSRFREVGAVIITCVNRDYTKKLIVQLPRQKHPYHRHLVKEETFQLLSGDLEVEIEGVRRTLSPGDMVLVSPGSWHKFHTLNGCVFEEISTTHNAKDSFYEDPGIARLPLAERKTKIPNWEAAFSHIGD